MEQISIYGYTVNSFVNENDIRMYHAQGFVNIYNEENNTNKEFRSWLKYGGTQVIDIFMKAKVSGRRAPGWNYPHYLSKDEDNLPKVDNYIHIPDLIVYINGDIYTRGYYIAERVLNAFLQYLDPLFAASVAIIIEQLNKEGQRVQECLDNLKEQLAKSEQALVDYKQYVHKETLGRYIPEGSDNYLVYIHRINNNTIKVIKFNTETNKNANFKVQKLRNQDDSISKESEKNIVWQRNTVLGEHLKRYIIKMLSNYFDDPDFYCNVNNDTLTFSRDLNTNDIWNIRKLCRAMVNEDHTF